MSFTIANNRIALRIGAMITGLVLMSAALAHEYKIADIRIIHPHARATVAQQSTGGAYLGLENGGKTDDKLIKVESAIAKSVEIHNMEMVGDIMKMREVDGIDLLAGGKVSMKPAGGYHIMLLGLTRQLKVEDKFPMTLYFAKAGKIEVQVVVEADSGMDH